MSLINLTINWEDFSTQLLAFMVGSLILAVLSYVNRKKIHRAFKKIKIKIFPINFQIVFALEFNEGLNSGNYFNQIKKDFLKQLHNSGLSTQLKIVDISDTFVFKNKEEAEKFRSEKGVDLVVWGDFTNDNLKINNEVVNKINLNFTFRIPGNQNRDFKSFISSELRSKFAKKNYWQIFEKNSLKDIEIITNNIFDISTYVLAFTLEIFGKLEDSTNLFEKLYNDLKRRNDELRLQIISNLIKCYDILSLEHGLYRKNYELGIKYCNKILAIDKNNFSALCNIAVFQYKSGDKINSYTNIEKLKSLYPNLDITLIDIAFFRIIEKNYATALKTYLKLKKKHRQITFTLTEVIEFLDDQYDNLNEPAFLFANGFLNCHYGDRESGIKDLNVFIEKANREEYLPMIKEAKRMLSIEFK